jgi:hypothetical protein
MPNPHHSTLRVSRRDTDKHTTFQTLSDMAFYIVLEGEHPLPDVDGKGLARAWDALEPLCDLLGVASLMSFFSMSEATQRHFDFEEAHLLQEEWFSATEGLKTVQSLLAYLQDHEVAGVSSNTITDLQNFERALALAEQEDVRWHLSIDD